MRRGTRIMLFVYILMMTFAGTAVATFASFGPWGFAGFAGVVLVFSFLVERSIAKRLARWQDLRQQFSGDAFRRMAENFTGFNMQGQSRTMTFDVDDDSPAQR